MYAFQFDLLSPEHRESVGPLCYAITQRVIRCASGLRDACYFTQLFDELT